VETADDIFSFPTPATFLGELAGAEATSKQEAKTSSTDRLMIVDLPF
jgi:hypothetical protein